MKKLFISTVLALSFVVLLSGCLAIGTGPKTQQTTLGQQLIDLQTAKNVGAITDAEYQAQKAKLLDNASGTGPAK